MPRRPDDLVHLRAAGVSLVLDLTGGGLPRIVHRGADLGDPGGLGPGAPAALAAAATEAQIMSNTLDEPVPLAVLPEYAAGWLGTPGLTGHQHGGPGPAVPFAVRSVAVEGGLVTVEAAAGPLTLGLEIELTPTGLVRQRATVTNDDPAPGRRRPACRGGTRAPTCPAGPSPPSACRCPLWPPNGSATPLPGGLRAAQWDP